MFQDIACTLKWLSDAFKFAKVSSERWLTPLASMALVSSESMCLEPMLDAADGV